MTGRPRVLVVDAKEGVLRLCREALGGEFAVETTRPGAAIDRLASGDLEVVLAERCVLEPIGQRGFDVELVTIDRPFDPDALLAATRAAAERRHATRVRRTVESRFGMGAMVGTSPAMRPVFEAIRRACADDRPVLLIGERGTGKELAARLVHQGCSRASGLFVRVGAGRFRLDRLRGVIAGEVPLADGGTLYVEELGDLPHELRASLPALIDATPPHRLAFATREMEAAGGLLDRAGRIELPPLRERPTDIPLLAAHFIAKHAPRIAPSVEGLTPAAIDALVAHAWPGNVRELEAVIERALVASRGDAIERHHIAPEILTASLSSPNAAADPASLSFKEALALSRERTSQQYIAALLRLCDGNVTRAADLAGLERESLHRLMRRYGIRSEYFKPQRKEGV